jgi:hypothetical protein
MNVRAFRSNWFIFCERTEGTDIQLAREPTANGNFSNFDLRSLYNQMSIMKRSRIQHPTGELVTFIFNKIYIKSAQDL